MAKPKNRRKLIVFSAIGLVLVTLISLAIFNKRGPVITVQTEKVARHSLTNIVVANGKIQPVLQVSISAEVSGEIIELPVKEGQQVRKGDLLVKINPDIYIAAVNQTKAGYESSLAAKASAEANLEKAQADYDRNLELFHQKLLSESDFIGFKAARNVARAQLDSANDQVNVAKALVDSAQDSLIKTTIVSPLDGTISKLNSQLGERVLGTAQFAGTEILVISDLNQMEARVDVGEMDVVGIKPGQKARLDVDAFKDRKFAGVVTDVASSSKDSNQTGNTSSSSQSQEATKFQVRIRLSDKEDFRPGMSVSADIETEYRTNVLTVPLASVTTRPPKPPTKNDPPKNRRHQRGHRQIGHQCSGFQQRRGFQRRCHQQRAAGQKILQDAGRRVCGGWRPCGCRAGENRHLRRQLLGDHRRPHQRPGNRLRRVSRHKPRSGRRQEDQKRGRWRGFAEALKIYLVFFGNIQQPTSNIEHPMKSSAEPLHWVLGVRCWMLNVFHSD